jgi:hypothetical protein
VSDVRTSGMRRPHEMYWNRLNNRVVPPIQQGEPCASCHGAVPNLRGFVQQTRGVWGKSGSRTSRPAIV